MLKAIAVDIDGVVLNSNQAYADVFVRVIKDHGVNISAANIYPHFGEHPRKIMKDVLKSKYNENVYADYLREIRKPYFIRKIRAISGSKRALLNMKKKYRLVAISGAVNASLYPALEKFSILKKFDLIISGDDIKQGKPHPEGLQKAIKKLRVSKDEIIYVGDAPSDVKFAKNAGVRAIVVLTGVLNKKSAKKLRPYLIVKDLNKLSSLLNKF